MLSFSLPDDFVDQYRDIPAPFGGPLGEATFWRTYSRGDNPLVLARTDTPDSMEQWVDTCRRVIEGMHSIEFEHCVANSVNYNTEKAQGAAREAFDLMFHLKWSPPGRGIEMMGTPFVHERLEVASLQNCAFRSTKDIVKDPAAPFCFLMLQSMLGVGVGFDVRGADKLTVVKPPNLNPYTYEIPDSREGWVQSIRLLLEAYLSPGAPTPRFIYDKIRPKGAPIASFGGKASGPDNLRELHERVSAHLDKYDRKPFSSRLITDVMNLIGRCVVSGNLRRSAEVAIGFPEDRDFVNLKNFGLDINEERAEWSWVSNNSIFVQPGQDYLEFANLSWQYGEPGYIWMDNVHNFERMNKIADQRDYRATGMNPCVEQPLEDSEMCTLTELYLPNIKSRAEWRLAIKHAYRYAKLVTIASEHIKDDMSREVMMRNRRIGLSVTGVTQFLTVHGEDELRSWLNEGYAHVARYDSLYAQWYGVPTSIRMTSVKPSGTVSTLAGVTPGAHFSPAGRYFTRRVNMSENSKLVAQLMANGYPVEPSAVTPDTVSVSFPVDLGPGTIGEEDMPLKAQMDLFALLQREWSGNSVSATAKFHRDEVSPRDLAAIISEYDTQLKAITFLPHDDSVYPQMPYSALTPEEYERNAAAVVPIHIVGNPTDLHEQDDKWCDGDACEIATYAEGAIG